MEKRSISKRKINLLKDELSYMERMGKLSAKQVESLLSLYVVKTQISFIRVLVLIGALLIGIGTLSFLVGNWGELPKFAKLLLIIVGLSGCYYTGWRLEPKYPKTARGFYYIGVFVYGAGIFLIGQMFQLDRHAGNAFGVWALGIFPLMVYLRDKWISLLFMVLVVLFSFGAVTHMTKLWVVYLAIPIMYWLNHFKLQHTKLIFFFQKLLIIYTICLTLFVLEFAEEIIPILIFVFGLILIYLPTSRYQQLLQWQGTVLYGISGIILTFPEYWSFLGVSTDEEGSVLFTILYVLLLLYFIKQSHLGAILVICALITRLYIDFSYDFLPKSLFFIFGGLILLGFGFWFEKDRRKGRKANEKEET